jgi:hypothetical protein
MTSLSYLHREEQIKEQVKMQSAKGKAKGGFTFAFCTLRFACSFGGVIPSAARNLALR